MSDEVAIIVKHKSTKAIIIFLLNRYSLVMFSAAALADFLPWDTQLSCEATMAVYCFCTLLLYNMSLVSEHNLLVTLTAFLLGILTVAVNLYLYIARHYEGVTRAAGMPFCIFKKYYSSTIYTECTQIEHYDVDAALTSSDVYSGIRSFDMLVLVVFWYKTYGIRQDAKKANGRPLLFYGLKGRFSALLVLNLSEIILIEEAFAYQTDFIAPCGFTQDIVDDHPTVHYQSAEALK
ncbi:predicted protein [Postia placenta Mad-698-R]|nr:predicted protein [Postia placenta Mad-698-R]